MPTQFVFTLSEYFNAEVSRVLTYLDPKTCCKQFALLKARKGDLYDHQILQLLVGFRVKAAADDDYPTGKKGGKEITFKYHGVDITVRLDKIVTETYDKKKGKKKVIKVKFNPRVSLAGGKDETTEALSQHVITHKDHIVHLLAGFRGEKIKAAPTEEEKAAYNAGVEARAVALCSDCLDYPANSAFTRKVLDKVMTKDDYLCMFIGSKGEGSYGVLPSQNHNTKEEDQHSRKAAYNAVGELLSKGSFTVRSTLKSNVPVLRKFREMLLFLNKKELRLFKISKNGVDQAVDHFTLAIDGVKIRARHMRYRELLPHRFVLSDAEPDSDDEYEKYKAMPASARTAYGKELLKMQRVALRKWRILKRIETKGKKPGVFEHSETKKRWVTKKKDGETSDIKPKTPEA